MTPLAFRIIANSHDYEQWLSARMQGVTATDAAHLTGPSSVSRIVEQKRLGPSFSGNAYTDYGRVREPEIASWVYANFGILHCSTLFCSEGNRRHLATPDGLVEGETGVTLAEIKTSTKPIEKVPRTYLRQIWWQQHVLGAERTLLAWEQHTHFVPVAPQPTYRWIERDDREIAKLVALADAVLAQLDAN